MNSDQQFLEFNKNGIEKTRTIKLQGAKLVEFKGQNQKKKNVV